MSNRLWHYDRISKQVLKQAICILNLLDLLQLKTDKNKVTVDKFLYNVGDGIYIFPWRAQTELRPYTSSILLIIMFIFN